MYLTTSVNTIKSYSLSGLPERSLRIIKLVYSSANMLKRNKKKPIQSFNCHWTERPTSCQIFLDHSIKVNDDQADNVIVETKLIPLSDLQMHRFRREARPQDRGSVSLDMKSQPPSIDLNYNHHLMKDDRGHLDAYGGANYDMHRVRPHAGLELERNYNNGFVRGRGEVMPGPRGRFEPQIMLETGFRF